MTDENGSSGYRLTREIAEVRGRLEMIIRDQESDSDTLKEIFVRLGILEKRMAQIVLIGTLVTIVLPVVFTASFVRVEMNQQTPQQKIYDRPSL